MEIKTHVLTNEQHLNDTQKLTARKNIGIKVEDVKNSAGESLVDEHGVVTIPDGVAVDPELSPTSTNPVQNKVVTAALNGKVDKVAGKDLSTNDYTDEEKNKLAGIEAGAEVNVQSDWGQSDETADDFIKNKPTIPTVNDGTLSIQVGTAQAQTFTANQSGDTSVTIPMASQNADGLMSSTDKTKLDTVDSGAEVNVQADWDQIDEDADDFIKHKPTIPTVNDGTLSIQVGSAQAQTFTANQSGNTSVTIPMATQQDDGMMSSTDKTKLDNIEADAEKNVQANWTEEDSSADSYIQNKPTIPTVNDGTLSIQVGTSAAQTFTANQAANTSVTIPMASQQDDGLMSSTDKTKLDGIVPGAEVNVQSDWDQTDEEADDFIKHKPTIPVVNDGTLSIQVGTSAAQTFTANQAANTSIIIPLSSQQDDGLMSSTDKTKLDGIEPGAEENVQADWDQTDEDADNFIKHKPTIPVVNDGTLSIQVGTAQAQTFTANQAGNTSITIPLASQQVDGLMPSTDKKKLDGIEPGAEENVQADWAESDNTSDSFIQHKPTDLWHGTPIDRETGNVVTGIERGNDGVPVIHRNATVMAVPVPDTPSTILGYRGDGTSDPDPDWHVIAKSTFGASPEILDEQTGEPILDNDGEPILDETATDLWATYDGTGFGAERAIADRAGNVIDETYATKTDIANKADKVSGATSGNFAGLDSNGNLTDSGVNASYFKTTQTAVNDPTVDGDGISFIDSISQNTNGEITPHKKTVQDALTTQKGVVQLADSVRAQVPSDTSLVPTEAAVRAAIDSAVSSAYHHAGTKRAAELSSSLLVAANEGNVYNISDAGTTTADFIEGAGHVIRVGDNVGVCQVSDGVYKFDLLSGIVDLSNYKTKQTAVLDPTASGNGLEFIDSISQDANGVIVPTKRSVQAVVASTAGVGGNAGVMSAADKEKLDGITDYVVSASVSGRTLTLTNKNGPATTFTDTGDTNVIESISVNGTAQTVTNKNVDLTIPDAANDATITIEVGGAASGATAPVAGDFSTNQDTAETITIPAAVSATQNTPAQPGVMSSADKEKLDNIAAFSSIQVTSGSTTGQVDADSATETLNLVAGDNITITADNTTKTIEISASLGAELGFLSGSATVNGIVNNGDVLTDPLTGMVNSNNGRFIIDTDTDDGHVYLYALKSIPDLVNGVDLFTISVNSNVSRTTANGFYGVAGLEILHKDNGNSLITESTESYASQVGECSVDLTVTVKNSTGTVTTIDGVDYYGYLIRYAGDSTASGDAINVVTRISVIEETVGIVEYNGSQSSLSAGNGISIDNDTINANLGDGLGLDANNNIEVKVGAGLKIDTSGGVATVAIDNVTEEVVETVQKLGEDLDKKITTTFPYAQITTMSDFMTYGTQGENRMFGQLFSVPITSELRVDDTVICVNALQSAPSIDVVFGIFEYDFSANNGDGSTYWLADTGVVHVAAGDNAFPIKNLINDVTRPSIELKSSCLYYAVWAVHNTGASNGLVLASCPGYGANYNAIPRYTVKTSGASVQVNWAGDGCLRNSWFSGYNEDNTIPRLFMMVRNKSDIQPSGNDPFIDITDYDLNDQYTINQIFGSTAPSADGAVFQKVIPARAVNITKFEWADTKSTVTATSSSPMVMDNSFGTTLTLADGMLTTAQNGDYYVHTFTLTNALAMTAGTVYWLPAQYNTVTETGMSDGGDNKLVQYNTNVARRDLQMIVDMAQPSGSGEFKASQIGVYLKLYDDNNNSWVI